MGDAGNEVGAQRFGMRKLLGHLVDADGDLVKMTVRVGVLRDRQTNGKIPLHNFLGRLRDPFGRTVDRQLSAQDIGDREQKRQEQHVQQRQLGRQRDHLVGQRQFDGACHDLHEQHYAAGNHKPNDQKAKKEAVERFQCSCKAVFLHLITAL